METSTKPVHLIGCGRPRALSLSAEVSEPFLERPGFRYCTCSHDNQMFVGAKLRNRLSLVYSDQFISYMERNNFSFHFLFGTEIVHPSY